MPALPLHPLSKWPCSASFVAGIVTGLQSLFGGREALGTYVTLVSVLSLL